MRRVLTVVGFAGFALTPSLMHAQVSDGDLAALRLVSVPATALPPISLPMPASRNHSYRRDSQLPNFGLHQNESPFCR